MRVTAGQWLMADSYETTREIEIELDGSRYRGRYRVMSGTVIVYYESEIKFAQYDMNRPEVVAKWLLTDLSRRIEAKKRKPAGG
jgi:hypothetical protein